MRFQKKKNEREMGNVGGGLGILFSLDPSSTFTFLLSYHHSSPIHIAVILPPPNHHLVLDVIEAVRINGNIKILWYLLLVRELVKSGEAG